jgi:DNA-binding MarR family transcriptional regulator
MTFDSPATPLSAPDRAPLPLPNAVSDNVGYLLAKTHLVAREIGNAALEEVGLEVREFGSLAILEDEGTISQQRLSLLLRCDRTTMVAIVDHLEGAELVERKRNPTDRRAYALEITPGGRQTLKRAKVLIKGAHEELLQGLSASERTELAELLRRILASN